MVRKWPAQLAVEALQAEGVTRMFGLLGGHIQPLMEFAYRAGIDVFQFRHEQAAAHAADAWARLRGEVGVVFGTAGPGMTNLVTGIHLAEMARTPLVVLLGGHKEFEADRGSMQEADAEAVLGSVTKWTRRIDVPEKANYYIRKAFRDAMTPPYGPVALEFPVDTFNWEPIDPAEQIGYRAGPWRAGPAPRVHPDPHGVDETVRLLEAAQRPLVIAGDGVHWDGAADALDAFARASGVPVNLRRHARGALGPDHPNLVPAGMRKQLIEAADLLLIVGARLDYLEMFGEWRTDAKVVQATRDPGDVALSLPTDVELTADATSLFEVLAARVNAGGSDERAAWLGQLGEGRERLRAGHAEAASAVADNERIHPAAFAHELTQTVPADVPIILDSFTASQFLAEQLEPVGTGRAMDAGRNAAFGHGVGMAIGAAMAVDGPVVSVLGDGGIGLGGGDIEVAARYGVPAVFVIYNNSALCGGLEEFSHGPGFAALGPKARGGYNVSQDVAYEEMYAPLGCHVERVEHLKELGPALERALASGVPAVVNVLADRDVPLPIYSSRHFKEMFWHLPVEDLQPAAKERHVDVHYPRYHDGAALEADVDPIR